MCKKEHLPYVLSAAAAAGLIAAGAALLPDPVAMQITLSGQLSNYMPKLAALAIPAGVTALGCVRHVLSPGRRDGLVLAVAGPVLVAVTLLMNR